MLNTDIIQTTNLNELRERIIIELRYYDAHGNNINRSHNAYMLTVLIRSSPYMRNTTEDYMDINPFGEGSHTEIDIYPVNKKDGDIVYSIPIEKDTFNLLSDILIQNLNEKIDYFSLKVNADGYNLVFTEEVMKHFFMTYTRLALDFTFLNSWIILPSMEASVKSLLISNANLKINTVLLNCENAELSGCILQAADITKQYSSLSIVAKKYITIHKIRIASKLFISLSCSQAKELKIWKDTIITLSDIIIGFKDISRNEHAPNACYNAILKVSHANTVRISGIQTLNDIPYYPLLHLNAVTDAKISDIVRSSVELPAASPAILLNELYNFSLSGITYNGVVESPPPSALIRFINSMVESSISISHAVIHNMALINLNGVRMQKLTINDCTLSGSPGIIQSETSSIPKITLSGLIFSGSVFKLTAMSLSIISLSKIETDEDIEITVKYLSNMSDSILNAKGSLRIITEDEASFNITKCNLFAVANVVIKGLYDENNVLTSKIHFVETIISGRTAEFSQFSVLNIENSRLSQFSKVIMSNCDTVIPGITVDYNSAPMSLNFNACYIKSKTNYHYNPPDTNTISFTNCEGYLVFIYPDVINPKSVVNIHLEKSPLHITLDAGVTRSFNINSNNSLGAYICGLEDSVVLVPDIESIDRKAFSKIKSKNESKHNEKIVYGIIQ